MRIFRHLWVGFLLLCLCIFSVSCVPNPEIQVAPPQSDVELITSLTLAGTIRGHLLAASELVELGYLDQSIAHLTTPIDSAYAELSQRIPIKPNFYNALFNVRDLLSIESFSNHPSVRTETERLPAVFNGATMLQTQQRPSLPVMLNVAEQLLKQAEAFYEQAISDGAMVNSFSYETARGLSQEVYQSFFKPIFSDIRPLNPVLLNRMEISFSRIFSVTPTIVLFGLQPLSTDEMHEAVNAFLESSRSLLSVP